MDKLFISCPMKGRKREDIEYSIQKMKNIAEAYVGETLEVIRSYAPSQNYQGKPIKCLGEAIKKMQDADYFIGIEYGDSRGCTIEREVACRFMPHRNIILVDKYKIMTDRENEEEGRRRTGETLCDCTPR